MADKAQECCGDHDRSAKRCTEVIRHFGHPARPASLPHWDFERAHARSGDPHQHLEVPPEGLFPHAEPIEHIAADGPVRRHIGKAHTVGLTDQKTGERPCNPLLLRQAAWLAVAFDPRAVHKIRRAPDDGADQIGDELRLRPS